MIKDLVDVADKIGLIQAVKRKLFAQPDPAADKLVITLEEISKIHGAIEAEITKYLGLWFDPGSGESIVQQRAVLIDLEGEKIKARIGKARGSCAKIQNIYNHYLNPWFQRVLNSSEVQIMQELFRSLDEYDGVMINAADELANWLGQKATQTLDMIESRNFEGANQVIQAARKEILPIRRKISDAMRELYDLQAEFIEASKAVGSV